MTTHEFCLFVDGADLSAASTVERLKRAGYMLPAAAADSGVQGLVFSRRAACLADAVAAAAAETECIPAVCIARDARSGAVAVFDPHSLQLTAAHEAAAPADAANTPRLHASREPGRSQHRSPTAAAS
jgi:hypothetical protein